MGNLFRNKVKNFGKSSFRTAAFLRKDIIDFLKQPRLLLQLVLGPFLILLLFGLGFSTRPADLQTMIVIDQDNPLHPFVEKNIDHLVEQLVLVDIVESDAYAKLQLANGKVDVVIVVPKNAYEKIQSNEQPVFLMYHNVIDPMKIDYVRSFTNVFIHAINRNAHIDAIEQAQQEMGKIQPQIKEAHKNATNLREAMQQGNRTAAQQNLSVLNQNLETIQSGSTPTSWLLLGTSGLFSNFGVGNGTKPEDMLAQILTNINALNQMDNSQLSSEESMKKIVQTEDDLAKLEGDIETFRQADPFILASPFDGKTMSIAPSESKLSDYYVPSTIVLLLQHLCITLGALSFVRERQTGTMELFKASPLKAIEVLVGKYVAYWVAGALVVGGLTGLLFYVLKMPILGNIWAYVLTLAVLMFTSLGIGFLLSLISRSISQAVQLVMITLLASIFFSGFFISLDQFQWYVKLISRIIPATYGINLLQDIMLRGLSIQMLDILILTGMGFFLFIIAWLGLRLELNGA